MVGGEGRRRGCVETSAGRHSAAVVFAIGGNRVVSLRLAVELLARCRVSPSTLARLFRSRRPDDRECRNIAPIRAPNGARPWAPNTSTVGASSAPQCAPKIGPFASEKFLECFVVRCSPISCVFGLTNRCSVFVLRIRLIYRFCRSINTHSTRANLESCRIFR